tara:strand:- start:584 stop:907 length:324 start_codon:yes stop_codon:yes gene_type:complete
MKTFFYMLGFSLVFLLASWSYKINYETRENIKTVKKLELEIKDHTEHYEILKAEWAYLNRPERLEKLVERYFFYLRLMPISSRNYIDISSLEFETDSLISENFENAE